MKGRIQFSLVGGTASAIKRTRTRTRAMMTAISEKIKAVDQVFVVGHKKLDMDALGASVGMQLFASNINERSYAVYDDGSMAQDIERAVQRIEADGSTKLITISDALRMVTGSFTLDHGRPFENCLDPV